MRIKKRLILGWGKEEVTFRAQTWGRGKKNFQTFKFLKDTGFNFFRNSEFKIVEIIRLDEGKTHAIEE